MSEVLPIVRQIAKLQQSSNSSYYSSGVIPSRRYHSYLPIYRQDNNIFFTALTLRILQEFVEDFDSESQKITQQIIQKAQINYPLFQSKEGVETYNFWQTLPSRHFPNGYLMRHFRHFQLPDDIDDTALIYTTSPQQKTRIESLRKRLIYHTNNYQKRVKSTTLKGVYPTWFGKHMPLDFDLCALSNWFLFLAHYDCDLQDEDLPSLEYLRNCLKQANFIQKPFFYAPHYPNRAIILYHYARLLSQTKWISFKDCQAHLQQLIIAAYNRSNHPTEHLILAIASLRLAEEPCQVVLPIKDSMIWFVAGMANYYLPTSLASWQGFHFRYNCPAYQLALQLEYQQLLKR